MPNENGFCFWCGADFDGEDIREEFIKQGKTESEADEIASNYGYRPGRTKWSRQINMYDTGLDRTVAIQCPDCKEMQ